MHYLVDLITELELNMTMKMSLLPETLFINLIDLKLQQWIHEMKDIDPSIDPVYLALKQNTPSTLLPDLKDWRME